LKVIKWHHDHGSDDDADVSMPDWDSDKEDRLQELVDHRQTIRDRANKRRADDVSEHGYVAVRKNERKYEILYERAPRENKPSGKIAGVNRNWNRHGNRNSWSYTDVLRELLTTGVKVYVTESATDTVDKSFISQLLDEFLKDQGKFIEIHHYTTRQTSFLEKLPFVYTNDGRHQPMYLKHEYDLVIGECVVDATIRKLVFKAEYKTTSETMRKLKVQKKVDIDFKWREILPDNISSSYIKNLGWINYLVRETYLQFQKTHPNYNIPARGLQPLSTKNYQSNE